MALMLLRYDFTILQPVLDLMAFKQPMPQAFHSLHLAAPGSYSSSLHSEQRGHLCGGPAKGHGRPLASTPSAAALPEPLPTRHLRQLINVNYITRGLKKLRSSFQAHGLHALRLGDGKARA